MGENENFMIGNVRGLLRGSIHHFILNMTIYPAFISEYNLNSAEDSR